MRSPFSLDRPRTCRRCGRNSEETRFAPTSTRRCVSCQSLDKAERIQRIADRAVPAAPAVVGTWRRTGENSKHLAWVRSMSCCVGGARCGTKTHAHHVRAGTGGGTGMKPPDSAAVPLCAAHHSEGHTKGWVTFEAKYRVDLRAIADGLAATSSYLKVDLQGASGRLPDDFLYHQQVWG